MRLFLIPVDAKGGIDMTEFTTEQRQYLEWVATPKIMRSPKTLELFAKSIGVDRTTLWRWSKMDGFSEQVIQSGRQYLRSEMGEIYSALVKRAVEGDVKAIKLALEVVGEYTPKQEIKGSIGLTWADAVRQAMSEIPPTVSP